MSAPQYEPIGFCIYCGASDVKLTREHIIPRGLGGNHVVPRASCNPCAAITSHIELHALRDILGVFRVRNGFKIKKNRTSIDLVIYQRGQKNLRIDQEHPSRFPYMIMGVDMPPPGIVSGRPPDKPADGELIVLTDDPLLHEKAAKGEIVVFDRRGLDINPFGRMLAKIAHAHLYGKQVRLSHYYLPKVILGEDRNVSFFVGGALGADPPLSPLRPTHPGLMHEIRDWSSRSDDGKMIHLVRIRLFSDHPSNEAPRYIIVAGEV